MTEIVLYDEKKTTAVTLFNGDGLDPFIESIREVADNFEGDLTTEKGRKEIKSLAYKISKAKNRVDFMRKTENETHQAQINANNKKGKTAWDALEALQDKVRKPVTDWENADKERIAKHEEILALIGSRGEFADWQKFDTSQIQAAINSVEDHFAREWGEFAFKAGKVKDQILLSLNNAIECRTRYDADQAELEKQRKAEEERKRLEIVEKIRVEAREFAEMEARKKINDAKKAAEDKAEAEKKAAAAKVEAEKKEAAFEAENQRWEAARREAAIERDKKAAIDRAEAAEQAMKDQAAFAKKAEAKRKAENEANIKKLAERAKRDRQAAVDRLQKKADDQKKKDAAELAAREADVAHKNKIIQEIEKALVNHEALPQRIASSVAAAIAGGHIPHVTIKY